MTNILLAREVKEARGSGREMAHPCRKRKREVKAFWCMLVIPSHMLNMEAQRRKRNIFGVTINRHVVFS